MKATIHKETIGLNDDWTLEWPNQGPVPAQVPGDVNDDLVRAEVLPEPLLADNSSSFAWVEETVFRYRRAIQASSDYVRAELVLHGIDGTGRLFLDGESIGNTANAFRTYRFDLTEALRNGGTHELIIEMESGVSGAVEQAASATGGRYICDDHRERLFLRKPQFSFGWDWAPRLVTLGLWRDVELVLYGRAAIADHHCTASCTDRGARLKARFDVDTYAGEWSGEAVLRIPELQAEVRAQCGPGAGELLLDLPEVERWYPAGFGDQRLYRVELELLERGEVIDTRVFDYGFRELLLDRTPGADGTESFRFIVNDRPLFCKGANWVPPDSLPGRVDPAKQSALIEAAVEAGFNMLRVWGGGVYPDDQFFELCDRHGILVWQDFMMACSEYPDDDPGFVEEFVAEARDNLRRLRHHPSLALWCGNNENHWIFGVYKRGEGGRLKPFYGRELCDRILPELCRELDPGRPYIPSSPFDADPEGFQNGEESGDVHAWEVTIHGTTERERTDFRRYRGERGRFISEYGLLAAALPATIRQFSGADTLEQAHPGVRAHDNSFNKGHTDACVAFMYGGLPQSREELIYKSNAYQAIGYREAILSTRVRLEECGGTLFWMYSDCWGTHGWTAVDYYLRRRPAWFWIRKAYAPIGIYSFSRGPKSEFYAINDGPKEAICRYLIEAGPFDGVDRSFDGEVRLPPYSVERVAVSYDLKGWIRSRLWRDESLLSDECVTAFLPGEIAYPETELRVVRRRCGDDAECVLSASRFAHFVILEHPDGCEASDNYLNLAAGAEYRITVRGCSPEDIQVKALNAATVAYCDED